MTITINGTVTLDESLGLQTGGIAVAGEDNNDNDVALSTLQSGASAFYNRLFGAGGLGLSTTFAIANGVAESADNFIQVSGGTVASLGFVDGDGATMSTYIPGVTDPTTGVATGLSAVNGGAIRLFYDQSLGNRMVLGVDSFGDIVFAIYMAPNAALTSAAVWMVQFEAISNPDPTKPDEPVNLFDSIGVAATTTLDFAFDQLHSGSNLFGTVGDVNNSLIVIAQHPVLKADGTMDSTSQAIKTSQGGTGATIGVDSQMFDPGEGAYFTYVKGSDPNFLAANLSQTEANDSAAISYNNGTQTATGASLTLTQTQGPTPGTMRISTFDIIGTPQGKAFVDGIISGGAAVETPVSITAVHVFDSSGNDVTGTKVSITGGVATVSGLLSGYTVSWTTSAPHDRVLIEGVAGKWDIGHFSVLQASSTAVDIGQQLVFEDSGPSITAIATGAPTLTVDETTLGADAGPTPFAGQFTKDFGTDGPAGTNSVAYALSTPGGASGLTDTATGQSVVLSLVGGQVLGKTAVSGDTVFVVSVDASGNVTLDQQRAIVHTDPNDPNESRGLTGTNLVVLTATVTDGDGDQAAAPLDLTPLLVFKDDGPSITANPVNAASLTVDETVLATNDTKAFAAQFTPAFGADGQGAAPVSYALSTPGGASGLTDTATGQSVVLSLVGGQVVGKTAVSGDTVFAVSVDVSGNVTLDQQRAIVHTDPGNPDESRGLTGTNLVVLTATVTDGDGDHAAAPLDLTPLLVFKDDGPSIGSIANSIVAFTSGPTGTAGPVTLNGVVGADPNPAPYTLDSFTPTITVNGVLLTGVLSANHQAVSYWADTNTSNPPGGTGDTEYYRLTLSETGAGSYTFQVLVDPPPAVLEFNFDALHSGSNLFGTVGDVNNSLIVIAQHPVLKADGTMDSTSQTIKTSQGGTGATIGIDSQMFDPGEGAYFTYVKGSDPNFLAANLSQTEANDSAAISYNNGTQTATSASLTLTQTQGPTPGTMRISAFDVADSPQGKVFVDGIISGGAAVETPISITSVTIHKANGSTQTENAGGPDISPNISFAGGLATASGLNSGDRIEWTTSAPHDRVLIEGVAGKWDVGRFEIIQTQPTPDQKLDFVARATDGDGDFATAGFSVGIDGTGVNHDGHVAGVG